MNEKSNWSAGEGGSGGGGRRVGGEGRVTEVGGSGYGTRLLYSRGRGEEGIMQGRPRDGQGGKAGVELSHQEQTNHIVISIPVGGT